MLIALCAALHNKHFLLSDNYASLYPKQTVKKRPKHGQIENTHAIFCPISFNLCIIPREKESPRKELLCCKDLQDLTEQQLAIINNGSYNSSHKYLYCEDEVTLKNSVFNRKLPHFANISSK